MSYLRLIGRNNYNPINIRISQVRQKTVDVSRHTLKDGSVLLCQFDNQMVFDAFQKKRNFNRLCFLFPFALIIFSRSDYEWASIYYELHDYYFGSGYRPDDVQYIWDGMWDSLTDFAFYMFIVTMLVGSLKSINNKMYRRFATHLFYNEERRAVLFRATDFTESRAHWVELPVTSVKFLCGEYKAIEPKLAQPKFQPGETVNGSLYKSQLGYSHAILSETPETPDLEDILKSYENESLSQKFSKFLNPSPVHHTNEGEILFYMRNGALANNEIFMEYFSRFNSDGDPFLLTHEAMLE